MREAGTETAAARRLLRRSAFAFAALTAIYAVVLVLGLALRAAPEDPVGDPWFSLMELLILAIAPALLAFSVALEALAPSGGRALLRWAGLMMAQCVLLTCLVHFCVLVLSRHPDFASLPFASQLFAFRWPSLAYALDILAWDGFFAVGAALQWLALRQSAALRWARRWLLSAALLALVGLGGVIEGDMAIRNVGILGYVLCYPLAALLVARALAPAERAPAGDGMAGV